MTPGDSTDEFHDLPLRTGRVVVVGRHIPTESSWERARNQPVGSPPGPGVVLRCRLTYCGVKSPKDVVAHTVAYPLKADSLSPSVCHKTGPDLQSCRYRVWIIKHDNVVITRQAT